MNSNVSAFLCRIRVSVKSASLKVCRRIFGFILLALLALATTVTIPAISAQPIERTSTTLTQTANAQSLLQQGIEFYKSERFSEAATIWQQANSAFAAQKDHLGQALVLSNLCLTYLHLGQWEAAEKSIAQSLNLLQTSKDPANSQVHREILAKALNAQGNLQWEKGQLEEALSTWKESSRYYAIARQDEGIILTKINQSKALQALGLSLEAEEILRQVYQNLRSQPNSNLKATGLRYLGTAFRRVGNLEQSQQVLEESLALAALPKAKSLALLELGNTARALAHRATAIGKEQEAKTHIHSAIEFYQQAANFREDAEASSLLGGRLQAQLNQLSLLVETGKRLEAGKLWPKIQQAIANLPPSRATIYAQLNLARSLTCLQPNIDSNTLLCNSEQQEQLREQSPERDTPSWQAIAQILATANQQAKSLQDRRAESYTLGQLGGLYELTGQWLEAQNLTQQALFLVETLQAPDIRYCWEWQLGRLLEKQGDTKGATAAYTRAVEALESIRSDLLAINSDVQFSFRDNVKPIYRGLVNLLLKTEGNAQPSPDNLKKAIRATDALQLAELENFLGCNLSAIASLDQVPDPKAAIIYPIILEDRIAIIFELPGSQQLSYQETPIPQRQVEATLKSLRDNLTVPGNTPEVLEDAQKVYQWMINPLEPFLQQSPQVETLVFVLDGSLRNIPMAVLYDGEQYLIEKKYALAVAPRVKLFSPKASEQRLNIFTGGVGIPQIIEDTPFSEIAKLKEELERIAEKTRTSKPLLDAEFTKTNIQQQLQSGNFSAVHWKTHGVFSSDPEATYIVAYKERIKAQDLNSLIQTGRQGRTQPLELMVLSACETAQGDDRAVLGLAGIAVRTGARSVLSTLWVAKDAPNTEFMVRFYEELSKPGMTKAQAVRQAQLALLKEYGYTTPYIWSTYVLVGNWL